MAPQHHPQQRRARARRRQHEDRRRVLRLAGRRRSAAACGSGARTAAISLLADPVGRTALPAAFAQRLRAPEPLHRPRVLRGQVGGEPRDRRRVEDRHHVDDLAQLLLQAVDEDRAGDRVAAELEEAVVDPQRSGLDAPAPRSTGRPGSAPAPCAARSAPRSVRRRVDPAPAAPCGPPCRWASAAAPPAPRAPTAPCTPAGSAPGDSRSSASDGVRLASTQRHVGHQPLVRAAAPSARATTTASRTAGMRRQRRLDLPQLDAEAAQLHLVVDAAQELDRAVRQAARQIARPVQPRARLGRERIGHEPLRRQLRPRPGSPRPTCTPPM